MSVCRLPQHAWWAAGASTRLMRTSVFDAPPRAIHGALSGVPGRRALLVVIASQFMLGRAPGTATSHRHS